MIWENSCVIIIIFHCNIIINVSVVVIFFDVVCNENLNFLLPRIERFTFSFFLFFLFIYFIVIRKKILKKGRRRVLFIHDHIFIKD